MNANDFIDVSRDAVWVMIKLAAIPMLTGLAVGIVISLVQALTQIQEMTLSFVPKVLSLFAVVILTLPFMIDVMTRFTNEVMSRIANGGGG
ncbi:MAG TPA: flagellar biosynthesis protein FliQ [Alphaproteobacteria bacterium]|jgi:flagellar biosynthetic protein FliQ|nr:flagellar biosynthesis protein FliQ [Alphaproteobacteria bacterium]